MQIVSHASFGPGSYDNDIALLRLSSSLDWTAEVRPICVPRDSEPVGTSCYITGWGDTTNDGSYHMMTSSMETFPRYWPFVWGIHRLPVNSPHKGQWRGALMFSLICGWIKSWENNREAGDLIRHRAHYDVIVILIWNIMPICSYR